MTRINNPFLQEHAQRYNDLTGLGKIKTGEYAPLDLAQCILLAEAQDKLPYKGGALADVCYRKLIEQLSAQYVYASDVMGVVFIHTPDDPYATSEAMREDFLSSGCLRVYKSGQEPHPYMDVYPLERFDLTAMDMFRAVHALFGHLAEGYGFGPRGEENAWRKHAQMLTPLAASALTTETRGNSAWFNFGPYATLKACDRPYTPQKGAILPLWARTVV